MRRVEGVVERRCERCGGYHDEIAQVEGRVVEHSDAPVLARFESIELVEEHVTIKFW